MNIDIVINQLRTANVLNGNVAGAAQYENAVQNQGWLPLPAAYVVPLGTDGGEVTSQTGYYQKITERIGVIVVLDNSVAVQSGDRRGQTPVAGLDVVQQALFASILNWRPDSSVDNPGAPGNPSGLASVQTDYGARGFYFDGADLRGWDLARLFYEFRFAIDNTITAADGWQPQSTSLSITAAIATSNTATITAHT